MGGSLEHGVVPKNLLEMLYIKAATTSTTCSTISRVKDGMMVRLGRAAGVNNKDLARNGNYDDNDSSYARETQQVMDERGENDERDLLMMDLRTQF